MFTLDEMKNNRIWVCHDCHSAFHHFITNKDLAKKFNTLEKLLQNQQVRNFVDWVSQSENRKFKH